MNSSSKPIANSQEGKDFPSLFLGTFQHRDFKALKKIVAAAAGRGITAFDTAPSYQNEALLGRVVAEVARDFGLDRKAIFLSTKIDGWQMQETDGNVEVHIRDAVDKLAVEYLDLLLIHWPFSRYLSRTWKTLIEAKESGLIRAIGLCNVNPAHVEYVIRSSSVAPDVIQNERHPLRTDAEVLEICEKFGIRYQAYSPLCRMHRKLLASPVLADIARRHSKSIGQVILRWHLDTGSIPIFMSSKPERISEYSHVTSFRLDEQEIARIGSLNENYKIFIESWGCPE